MGQLNGTHKTNITSVETAINTAINSLMNPSDAWQNDARIVLERMRRDLDLIKVIRNQ